MICPCLVFCRYACHVQFKPAAVFAMSLSQSLMQWLLAFNVALKKGPPREPTEKSPCDDVMLLVAQNLHVAYTRSSSCGPRNIQMALAAVVALRAALAHSPHNAELRLEVCLSEHHRAAFVVSCGSHVMLSSFHYSMILAPSVNFFPSTGSSM